VTVDGVRISVLSSQRPEAAPGDLVTIGLPRTPDVEFTG
jgi:hypothetical protein